MEDIAGLDFTSTPANGQKPTTSNYSAFSTLKPTPPASGRASPLNPTTTQPPSKPATPASDSFANLVSFGATSNKNLSLREEQKRQTEAKLRQQQAQKQILKDQYAGGDDQFWNSLGSGRGIAATDISKLAQTASKDNGLNDDDDDDDLFAAFNKPATARHDPPAPSIQKSALNDDDDDPFGLTEGRTRRTDTTAPVSTMDDDDVLGLLGRPVSARPRPESPPPVVKAESTDLHPQDKAVAELVDMGFPADKARFALDATESGVDVQTAVGFLLNQAHSESRQKAHPRNGSRQGGDPVGGRRSAQPESQSSRRRMRFEDGCDDSRGRQQDFAPAADKNFEHMATQFSNNFLKTAGSLWKQGTKRVQLAVQEFNSDSDSGSQPRWMREAERPRRGEHQPQSKEDEFGLDSRRKQSLEPRAPVNVTDEALMLEASRPTPPPRLSASSRPDRNLDSSADNSRDHSPVIPSRLRESLPQSQPAFMRQQNQSPALSSRAALNKAAADEQAAQAYVSSARRRKPQPAPQASVPALESDLLESGFKDATPPRPTAPTAHKPPSRPQSQPVKRIQTPVRPPPPTRTIPPILATSLEASHSHREKGNEHFKRGDYSSAHDSYGTSLSHLPDTHPLRIVLLTNHALTALKIGEPKTAIVDADKAISIIGPSKGESETIDFATGSPTDSSKPMREYYGKALMRKAEALEQMEKWSDAAAAWREAIEGGHGGSTSIQGRMRAEKAANPAASKPKPVAPARKLASSAPPASIRRPARAATLTTPAVAVSRLRAANAAAEKADDEKFRLADSVDARIHAWRGGKADNLRALLGSLDTVLWEGSGWKKISMADLVLPGKVKLQYMKGIAKVHPDKVRPFLFRDCQTHGDENGC